ncbi:MAG: hypothetical protein H0W15_07820 [Gemmatimonadales bacterium]|nr:hypothetical protein [Gemmatimonadales bacterium]
MGDGVGDFAFWIAIGVGQVAFWAAMTPLIKAFARRIEGRGGSDDVHIVALEARLTDIENRALTSGEVDNQFIRLAELEERVDFAERLLTQAKPGALPVTEES